jgi:hypothetical protein
LLEYEGGRLRPLNFWLVIAIIAILIALMQMPSQSTD